MPKHVLLFVILAALTVRLADAGDYAAPLMSQPPKIDGKIEPGEWQLSTGFDGFAMNGLLERRKIRAWIGATTTHFYLALKSQLPDEGALLAQITTDTLKVVYDDSVEVWIDPTPGSEHGCTFQMLVNSLGRQGYNHHPRGNVRQNPTWRGTWTTANGFHDGFWHCELAVPIEEIAPGRKTTDGVWGINLCRNWKQEWAFSSLGGGAYAPTDRFVFLPDAPAIWHENRADCTLGDVQAALIIYNPTNRDLALQTRLLLKRDMMPELEQAEGVTIPPGSRKELLLKTKDEITRTFDMTLSVLRSGEQAPLYSRSYKWKRSEPWRWSASKPEVLPVDFQFGYYPYLNTMRVLADVSNLPPAATLDHLLCTIRAKGGSAPLKTVRFDRFTNGKQELMFDLPPLKGEYEIAMTAVGAGVPAGELVKSFQRTVYDWERGNLGKSTKVYPPFTPIRVQGKRVSVVLRDHDINDLGLWDQVIARDKSLLASPMTFTVSVDGQHAASQPDALRFDTVADHQARSHTSFRAAAFRATAEANWDYDGTMRMDLALQPSEGKSIQSLTLDIPLRADAAQLLHAMGDGIRNTLYERIPSGQGVVWTSEKVQANDLPKNFCSYIYIGTPVRGLCWFAENDRGWSWDPAKPNVELIREPDKLTLRVHLINKPVVISEPRIITFGLLAAPVKPFLGDWRYKWNRDKYTLLGTDINWFALGDCGSVYPAHKDMFLWEMIARGNREQLPAEDIKRVIDHGMKYFEPYGPDYVERWVRHVRHNLRARFGKKMVFYYNRASFQLADEFQTFQDEWCLTDYRTVGPGNRIGEIKIIPSASYIDHALYWYGKSFDNGANQGVYWDNWFLVGTYNRMMSPAYAREDGAVVPATGLWGLRELSKRTFQYMNERGMLPITMPHMTSTNILPMHSFATVQYDWEWKYSEGDVQYRFPREYILLVSTGELAGAWPVLLGDHGKLASDPWTQRTFAGVAIVHELNGYGMPKVWDPLLNPIYALIAQEDLEVYRYWDERPQPVRADNSDLPSIVYSLPGKEALFAVTSYAQHDVTADLAVDLDALGLPAGCVAVDVESGERLLLNGRRLSFPLRKHDVREFRLLPLKKEQAE